MSGASDLAQAVINLQTIREDDSLRLIEILQSIKGPKFLVLDSTLGGPLNLILVEGSRTMREHGVVSLHELNWADVETDCETIVYIVRPTVKLVKQVASQLKAFRLSESSSNQAMRKKFHLYFVPRRSIVCEQVLKDEGIYDMIENNIGEYQLGFIPVDNDVLSLEIGSSFRDVEIDGDRSSLVYSARALLEIQSLFGPIKNIQSKGNMSKMVIDLMLRMRSEAIDESESKITNHKLYGQEHEGGASSETFSDTSFLNPGSGLKLIPLNDNEAQISEIDTLLLLDRSTDLITPMCTALTYESLIDEIYGIQNGYIYVDSSISGDSAGEETGQVKDPKEKEPMPLNSNDPLYDEIRDLNITVLMRYLNEKARNIKEDRKQVDRTRQVSELHAYVKKLPQVQAAIKSLSRHINLTQILSTTTMDRAFRARWHAERAMLEGESQLEYIEDCISKQEPLIRVLRLVCLQSQVNNGIKQSKYDSLRRSIIQTYGFNVLFTLDKLEKVGLVKRRETSNPWPSIRKNFQLIAEKIDPGNPDDIAYVTSGYAPLSVRLVQLQIRPGWKNKVELLKQLPGATIFDVRQPGVQKEKSDPQQENVRQTTENSGRKVLLVFYVGGVTYAEISALRFVARQKDCPYDIVVATTKIINGSNFIKSIVHEVENRIKW